MSVTLRALPGGRRCISIAFSPLKPRAGHGCHRHRRLQRFHHAIRQQKSSGSRHFKVRRWQKSGRRLHLLRVHAHAHRHRRDDRASSSRRSGTRCGVGILPCRPPLRIRTAANLRTRLNADYRRRSIPPVKQTLRTLDGQRFEFQRRCANASRGHDGLVFLSPWCESYLATTGRKYRRAAATWCAVQRLGRQIRVRWPDRPGCGRTQYPRHYSTEYAAGHHTADLDASGAVFRES